MRAGTGVVTCHFATAFPSAQVYGIDLSPVPESSSKPENVSYIQGIMPAQATDNEVFCKDSFDLIFSRLLLGGMQDWQEYVKAAASLLKPGGFMEAQDLALAYFVDGVPCDQDWTWWQTFISEARNKGMDLECGKHMQEYMRNAGLEVVEAKRYKWPWGSWLADEGTAPESRQIGVVSYETSSMFEGMLERMLDGRYCEEVIAEFQRNAMRNLYDKQERKYQWWYVTIARKPA